MATDYCYRSVDLQLCGLACLSSASRDLHVQSHFEAWALIRIVGIHNA